MQLSETDVRFLSPKALSYWWERGAICERASVDDLMKEEETFDRTHLRPSNGMHKSSGSRGKVFTNDLNERENS